VIVDRGAGETSRAARIHVVIHAPDGAPVVDGELTLPIVARYRSDDDDDDAPGP
jgi:hypothetical protein